MIRRPPRSTLFPYTTFFFFNDTATTEIYTLSLHDALPIWRACRWPRSSNGCTTWCVRRDRKSTRLNSSHDQISYAVFCLKKKKKKNQVQPIGTPSKQEQQHHNNSQHD